MDSRSKSILIQVLENTDLEEVLFGALLDEDPILDDAGIQSFINLIVLNATDRTMSLPM
jgi:hypothetical protein